MERAKFLASTIPGGVACEVYATGSMLPNIGFNTILVLEAVNPKDLQVGDVIYYVKPGEKPNTHAVDLVGESAVITRGYNTTRNDGYIQDSWIKYRLVSVIFCRKS